MVPVLEPQMESFSKYLLLSSIHTACCSCSFISIIALYSSAWITTMISLLSKNILVIYRFCLLGVATSGHYFLPRFHKSVGYVCRRGTAGLSCSALLDASHPAAATESSRCSTCPNAWHYVSFYVSDRQGGEWVSRCGFNLQWRLMKLNTSYYVYWLFGQCLLWNACSGFLPIFLFNCVLLIF